MQLLFILQHNCPYFYTTELSLRYILTRFLLARHDYLALPLFFFSPKPRNPILCNCFQNSVEHKHSICWTTNKTDIVRNFKYDYTNSYARLLSKCLTFRYSPPSACGTACTILFFFAISAANAIAHAPRPMSSPRKIPLRCLESESTSLAASAERPPAAPARPTSSRIHLRIRPALLEVNVLQRFYRIRLCYLRRSHQVLKL